LLGRPREDFTRLVGSSQRFLKSGLWSKFHGFLVKREVFVSPIPYHMYILMSIVSEDE
jgi:hypothetical protein